MRHIGFSTGAVAGGAPRREIMTALKRAKEIQ
jgi:hypothetical protein